VNDEWESTGKEAVIAWLQVLSLQLPGGPELKRGSPHNQDDRYIEADLFRIQVSLTQFASCSKASVELTSLESVTDHPD
jgi:hypothetical protein